MGLGNTFSKSASSFGAILSIGWLFFNLIPFFAVSVRRLHDINLGESWVLLYFIPGFCIILFLILAQDSYPYENKYGPVPEKLNTYDNRINYYESQNSEK